MNPPHFFIPDVRGRYEVGLIARNGSVVSFENKQRVFVDEYETYYLPGVALNDMPFGYVNQPVELSITGDSAFGTDASSSEWRLVEYPEGSLSPELRVNGLSVNFTPDAAGKYVFEVTSRNEYVSSNVHVVEVYVSADTLFDLQQILIPSDFGDASPIGRIPKDLIVEDYNADDLPDIFLPLAVDGFHPEQETLILSKSDPLNHFSVSSFSTPTEISSLLISDFKDEGHSALVFRDSLGLTIKEAETLTELNSLLVDDFFTISNQGLKLDDVNLDGRRDIVFLRGNPFYRERSQSLEIHLQDAHTDYLFGEAQLFELVWAGGDWFSVQVVDIDGGADQDIVVTGYNPSNYSGVGPIYADNSAIVVFEQNDDGSFSDAERLNISELDRYPIKDQPHFKDLDGDGDTDLMGILGYRNIYDEASGGLGYWLQNEDGQFEFKGRLLGDPSTNFIGRNNDWDSYLAVEDLNNDNMADIALAVGNHLMLFFQTSVGEFDEGEHFEWPEKVYGYSPKIEIEDMDNDGDKDVVFLVNSVSGPHLVQLTNLAF